MGWSTSRSRQLALTALLAGPFVGVVDVYVVTIATPSIRVDLGATFGQAQLVVAVYAIAYAVGLITGGRLGDRYGRRRLYVLGFIGFTVMSVLAATAVTPAMLIIARAVQGLAAAAMIPQALAIIRATIPEPARSKAIGLYGMIIGLGAVSGPVIGGLLMSISSDASGWRLIFIMNLPIGVLASLGALLVPESRAQQTVRMDVSGMVLSGAGIAAILLPLMHGPDSGWPTWTVAMMVGGFLSVGVFFADQYRKAAPLLPVHLFPNRRFTTGLLTIAILYGAGVSAPMAFILPYYYQTGLGHSPLQAGIAYAPVGLGYALGSRAAGALFMRAGPVVPTAGIFAIVLSVSLIAVLGAAIPHVTAQWFMPILLIAGIGQGLAVIPVTSVAISSVDERDAGAASGLLLTVTQVAAAFGVALAGGTFLNILGRGGHHYGFAIAASLGVLALLTALGLLPLRRMHLTRTDPNRRLW